MTGPAQRTHWYGCWRDPTHHACAVEKMEQAIVLLNRWHDAYPDGALEGIDDDTTTFLHFAALKGEKP